MSGMLSVLAPLPMTHAMLVSSTVPEADYAQWLVGTTYALGQRVIDSVTHRIYESAKASNIGKNPTDINNRVGTSIWWIDISATNRWMLFDTTISTPMKITATSAVYVINTGAINSLYFAGLDADSITVTMKNATGGTQVYSKIVNLSKSPQLDYWEHFFAPYVVQEDTLFTDLPSYSKPELTITLARSSGEIKCGALIFGDLKQLGRTLKNPVATPKTYSYIKITDTGESQIKRRKSAKDISVDSLVMIEDADNVVNTMTSLLDVPAVFIGSGSINYAGLRAFGLGSATVTYSQTDYVDFKLNVNGLI